MAQAPTEGNIYDHGDMQGSSPAIQYSQRMMNPSVIPSYYDDFSNRRLGRIFSQSPVEESDEELSISQEMNSLSYTSTPVFPEVLSCLTSTTQQPVDNFQINGRPGTPALTKANVETTYNRISAFNIQGNDHAYTSQSLPYDNDSNFPLQDMHLHGGGSVDHNHPFPPSHFSVPPSQLYSLLLALQSTTRSPDVATEALNQQNLFPSHLETSKKNCIRLKNACQDDRNIRIGEISNQSGQPMGSNYNMFRQQRNVSRRPAVTNINYLTHSMVRPQPTGVTDQSYMDRNISHSQHFAEDGEGNHECHSLQHGTNQTDSIGTPVLETHNAHGIPTMIHPSVERGGERLLPTPEDIDTGSLTALGAAIYQGEWPINRELWVSGPSSIGEKDSLSSLVSQDTASIMSFSSTTATSSARRSHSHQLGTKVEMVYSLLSMLGSNDKDSMSRTLLAMSSNQDSCIAMRQSGCLPLLIQLLHGGDRDSFFSEEDPQSMRWAVREARRRASQALHNIVHAHPDDKRGRREARVLRLLEQIRDYSDYLRDLNSGASDMMQNDNLDLHPGPAIAALMKLSFDEEHRHAMCQLGGLQAIAELIQADHEVHGNTSDQFCITVRRYAGMALTNLTFGDGTNKALLCSMKTFMQALVSQLHSPSEDLRQVTASVLRNLSWRADVSSKQILREVGAIVTLMKAAMEANKESTLKSILSALWNLSAHCSVNKADICAIDGALAFLVSTLIYNSSSKTLSIIENGGGILRNISSHIAVREDYRAVLRKQKCLQTLLGHLKSPSLTVVSNACGTLWNLSARCPQDQQTLWEMGAVGMLRNLVHSKHKMISMGSSAALKNLLAAKPPGMGIGLGTYLENGHFMNGSTRSNTPSLLVRKQKALEAEIDQNLSETCDNLDSPKTSPTPQADSGKRFNFDINGVSHHRPQNLPYLPGRMYHSVNGHVASPIHVPRSESKDSLGSTRSEPPHYRAQRDRYRIFVNNNRLLQLDSKTIHENPYQWKERTNLDVEDNSNIVIQLFKSLHKNVTEVGVGNSDRDLTNGVAMANGSKPATRPNTLPTQKREAWNGVPNLDNVSVNNLIPTDAQNGAHFAFGETNHAMENNQNIQYNISNGGDTPICYDIQNGAIQEIVSPKHKQLNQLTEEESSNSTNYRDFNVFLDLPDNKRPVEKRRLPNNIPPSTDNSQSAETLNGHSSSDQLLNMQQFGMVCGNMDMRHRTNAPFEGVVLRRRMHNEDTQLFSESIQRGNSVDDESTDRTPLVVSRCSSLSSLTSCIQQSARSSWVSDISQRTSDIISPTELPDSPGLELPENKHKVFEFTDKAPDPESHGVIRPRPAWPSSVSSMPSSDSLPSPGGHISCESEISTIEISPCKVSDSRRIYLAEEQIGLFHGSEDRELKFGTSPGIPRNSPEKDSGPSSEGSSPQDDETGNEKYNQEETDNVLLAACVSLGMPNNNSLSQHNNSKLHSKVNNLSPCLSYLRSGIPVKANIVRSIQSIPNIPKPPVLSSCAVASADVRKNQNSELRGAVETSISDSGRFDHSHQLHFPCESSCDSVCDDNDNLVYHCENAESIHAVPDDKSDVPGSESPETSIWDKASPSSIKSKLPFLNTKKRVETPKDLGAQSKVSTPTAANLKSNQSSKKYPPSTHFCGFSHAYQGAKAKQNQQQSEDHSLGKSKQIQFSSLNASSPGCSTSVKDWISSGEMQTSEGKLKTAIPQIVRPWNPSMDQEVHPRQLQVMSQNLPVYIGSYAAQNPNQRIGEEANDMHRLTEDESKDFSKTSSLSSLSDDSGDRSSTEVVQGEHTCSGTAPDKFSRSTRPKVKRSKHARRSMEIPVPDDHSSEDDNKNTTMHELHGANTNFTSVPSSDCEEKGKEDERTREKSGITPPSANVIPDLLEGARIHLGYVNITNSDGRLIYSDAKSNGSPKGMSESIELRRGAQMVAAELEDIADDFTHSSISCLSDLENAKPPSVMGEMSMTSSGLSDLLSNGNGCYMNGKPPADRRRNIKRSKKANGSHRFVLKTVRNAFNGTFDATKSLENHDKPPSLTGSVENLSMKSSGTSELLENINPPSIMDDISMTNSCASLNSINSDILESRSQSNSEMFQRLNAAAAMVQVYSRELSNIMTGSMKSSFTSDNLDMGTDNIELVNPPSIFHEVAEVTVEDGTEVGTDALGSSDSEVEEELPHDDEGSLPSSDTIYSPHHLLSKGEQGDGSTENLTSSIDGDSIGTPEKPKPSPSNKRISNLALTPQNPAIINIVSNTVQYTSLLKDRQITEEINHEIVTFCDDTGVELNEPCEEEDENILLPEPSPEPSPVRKGPRIVKPINRETVRQMQEKKSAEKAVKSIRGRVVSSSPRNLLQSLTNAKVSPRSRQATVNKSSLISAVRPTRTSALRASQNQKQGNTKGDGGRMSPRSFLSKPPTASRNTKMSSPIFKDCSASTNTNVTVLPASACISVSSTKDDTLDDKRPNPPVKQNTFTKDKPTQNAPEINPVSPNDPNFSTEAWMTKSQTDSIAIEQPSLLNNRVKSAKAVDALPSAPSRMSKAASRKLSYSSSPVVNRSSSNYSLRRNLSAPTQRRVETRGNLCSSPSSQSLGKPEDAGKKANGKRSPSSVSLSSHVGNGTADSRGGSSKSLSSLSSSGQSLKTSNIQKEITSKISSIWKRSESSSSTSSALTESPSLDRSSPSCRGNISYDKSANVRTCYTPNGSTVSTPTSSRGIPHSSTFEKLSRGREEIENLSAKFPSNLLPSASPLEEKDSSNKPATTGCKSGNGQKFHIANISKQGVTGESSQYAPPKGRNTVSAPKGVRQLPQSLQKSKLSKMRGRSVVSPGVSEATLGFHTPQTTQSGAMELETKTLHPLEVKTSPASAVVPPFNYIPSPSRQPLVPDQGKIKATSIPSQRRNSYINSIQPGEDSSGSREDDEEISERSDATSDRKTCLVTMV